jgi:sulfide:quinone oxidoreductase
MYAPHKMCGLYNIKSHNIRLLGVFLFQIPGLIEGLKDHRSGVCSNYSPLYVTKTYGCIQRLDGGSAVFTYPNSPVKCAGAPQKIAYITADYMQRV